VVAEGPFETTVEVGAEFLVRRARRGRKRADDELGTRRQVWEAITAQVAEAAKNTMAVDGAADSAADHEPRSRRDALRADRGVAGDQVHHECLTSTAAPGARDKAQLVAPSEAMLRW
jgi:hypothetical protein